MTDLPTVPAAPAEAAVPRRRLGSRVRVSGTDRVLLFVMVAIPLAMVVLWVWLPAIASVVLSFARWTGVGGLDTIEWIGTENYKNVFTNYPPFAPALQHNVIWLVFLFVLPTLSGIFLAVLLDRELRGTRFYQTAFFLPVVLSLALIGFIWQLMYSRDQGLLNAVLGTQIDWYGDSKVNLWAVLVAAGWKHAGYIMLLYLAGLKGVDPSLREAAAVDGASPARAFFSVVLPVMRPINIIIIVVTVIESLRAFDIVWVINKGTNGLELISTAVTAATTARNRRRLTPGRVLLYVFVVLTALAWLFPVVWALFNSFRDYDYTSVNGYVSLGGFTFENYTNAWEQGEFTRHFLNSLIITVPAVLPTLFLASCVAFVVARYSFRFNLVLLGLFTAANLLPQQALLIPLYRAYREIPLPLWMSDSGQMLDSYWGLILVNVAFQTGFCTFVLSNYMKALPHEMLEAARVDGAGVPTQFFRITLPLCRPALAALATLQVTWIYNEFYWATVLMQSGDKFPITSSLTNLRGQFFTDYNLLSAGSVVIAIPVLVIFFLLQKQFVAGLTLGSTKGC